MAGPEQGFEGVGGHRRALAVDLDRRCLDAVDLGDRELDQRQPIAGRRDDPPALLPRITGGNHEHPIEAEPAAHLRGDDDVADVHGIEGAAEHADPLRSFARHRAKPRRSPDPVSFPPPSPGRNIPVIFARTMPS